MPMSSGICSSRTAPPVPPQRATSSPFLSPTTPPPLGPSPEPSPSSVLSHLSSCSPTRVRLSLTCSAPIPPSQLSRFLSGRKLSGLCPNLYVAPTVSMITIVLPSNNLIASFAFSQPSAPRRRSATKDLFTCTPDERPRIRRTLKQTSPDLFDSVKVIHLVRTCVAIGDTSLQSLETLIRYLSVPALFQFLFTINGSRSLPCNMSPYIKPESRDVLGAPTCWFSLSCSC